MVSFVLVLWKSVFYELFFLENFSCFKNYVFEKMLVSFSFNNVLIVTVLKRYINIALSRTIY